MTDDPGWHGARLREAFGKRGFTSDYVSLTRCRLTTTDLRLPVGVPGFEKRLPDGVFVRGVPGGTLDEVVFYLDILHALKHLGIPVYNDGRAIERSVDKGMTSFLLQNAGIHTPPTWVVKDREEALSIAENELRAGNEIVSKPLFGSQGIGLQRISTLDDLPNLADNNGIYYLQRFIRSTDQGFHDWRVFVIDGKTVSVMRRIGNSWLNNVAQGARCEPAHLDETMNQLAEAAIDTLEMDYGGVDIISDEQRNYNVVEVNSIPAWKGLQSVSKMNIADMLVSDFLRQCPASDQGEFAISWR